MQIECDIAAEKLREEKKFGGLTQLLGRRGRRVGATGAAPGTHSSVPSPPASGSAARGPLFGQGYQCQSRWRAAPFLPAHVYVASLWPDLHLPGGQIAAQVPYAHAIGAPVRSLSGCSPVSQPCQPSVRVGAPRDPCDRSERRGSVMVQVQARTRPGLRSGDLQCGWSAFAPPYHWMLRT